MKTKSKSPIVTSLICSSRAIIIYLLLTLPLLAERNIYLQSAINAFIAAIPIFTAFTLFLYWYKSKVNLTQHKIFMLLNVLLVLGFIIVMSGITLSYVYLRLEVFTLYVDKLLFPIMGILSFSLAVWTYRRSMYVMLLKNQSNKFICTSKKNL